jgi:pilus assembly protein Flp/PilA
MPTHQNRRNRRAVLRFWQEFLRREDGPTAVEYAVMLALIVIVCLTAITSIGTNARTSYTKVATSLQGSS